MNQPMIVLYCYCMESYDEMWANTECLNFVRCIVQKWKVIYFQWDWHISEKCKAMFYLAEAVYCLRILKPKQLKLDTADLWDQLYPTLIACVEYIAYEFRKSFQLTSPRNNHWFIVLEMWNKRFSFFSQSPRGFIGFFHFSNNYALFWFLKAVYTTKLFSWSSFPSFTKQTKIFSIPASHIILTDCWERAGQASVN